jgi:hypothetical protein
MGTSSTKPYTGVRGQSAYDSKSLPLGGGIDVRSMIYPRHLDSVALLQQICTLEGM